LLRVSQAKEMKNGKDKIDPKILIWITMIDIVAMVITGLLILSRR